MKARSVDVLVCGGGGCGLSLSLMLGTLGVDFLMVERHEGTSILPKAHYLNPRTMEILRQFGADEEIYEQGTPPYNRSRTKWFTSFAGDGALDGLTLCETGSLGGHGSEREADYRDASPSDSANLPQIRLEPLLRAAADRHASGQLLFNHSLEEFWQDTGGVTATVRNRVSGETFQVRAKYLVGADGGRTVGKRLGIEMKGPTDLITQVGVHFEADLSRIYPDDRVLLNWLRPAHRPGVSVIVAMGPEKWGRLSPEWSLGFPRMPFDPAEITEDYVIAETRKILGVADLSVKVRCISEWSVEGVLADRYVDGRVILAGDAAHRHPPTTGLGLNTGIQDAHNLAWKLAMLCRGTAGPALLSSYERERRPIGAFNVEWALNAFFNHMLLETGIVAVHPDNLANMQTPEHGLAAFRALLADSANGRMRRARMKSIYDTQNIEFYARDVELGFAYEDGAFLRDGTPAPERDPLGQDYCPVARPGHRLPHCWLFRAGRSVSTHDLSGSDGRFVLIVQDGGVAWKPLADAAARKAGLNLDVVCIGRDGDAYDAEGRWRGLCGTEADGCVLVRPDNIVAWRSVCLGPDAAEDLKTALERTAGR